MAVRDQAADAVTKAKRRIGMENPSAADADGNVGTVRGALRAFGEGNFDAFLDVLQDDVQWEAPGGDFPGGDKLEGCEAIKDKFLGDVERTFSEFGFVPDNFVDTDDDAVIVVGRFTGDAAEGDELDTPAVQIWQFGRGSEAELIRIYTDGAAFPELITEEKLKEREEEEKKRKEEEEKKKEEKEKAEAEAESEDDDEDESDEDKDDESDDDAKAESKSETDSESKSETDSESKSETDSESTSDSESEAKSESSDDSESDQDSDSEKKKDDSDS
jgi:ketosteroid isomerase-like protein